MARIANPRQQGATAAALAIEFNISVQEVDYENLQNQLKKDKQVLGSYQ